MKNDDEKIEWEHKMFVVSYCILVFGNLYLFYHLCHVSDGLATTIGELEEFILQVLLNDDDYSLFRNMRFIYG